MENHTTPLPWNTSTKIAFRFVFIFFGLFILMTNNGAYPFWDLVFAYPTEWLHTLIPWIGKHILALPNEITVFPNGSGDTTYDYVLVLTAAATALIGTILWSIVDRKSTHYKTLYYWLTVAVRFYVGLMLIQYGLYKVIKLQFPSPNFYRLTQAYGDSSPMGLAWTFLGFSKGYNFFMGIAEVAAILLLFRRTMTLGAIITLMTTANVMAVNYFYDVPVKIVSTALVTMTLFLLLHNIQQLWKFFFTREAVSLQVIAAPEIHNKWLRLTKVSFKVLLIGYCLIFGIVDLLNAQKQYGEQAPKPPLYGLYEVDLFIQNHDTIPPLLTDSVRWKQLVMEYEGYARIRHLNDKVTGVSTKIDTVLHQIDFTDRKDTTMIYSFRYEHVAPNKFHLKGTVQRDSVSILMTRKSINDFLLMNRGFHWINEYPFNR